ncbi:MAG: HAD-IC family P-type ATPase [Nitrospiraceae bacterium]|nr:HAD-IC family P-type ATPase [Nitrospiraceae bacterium]
MFKSTDYYKTQKIEDVFGELGTVPDKGLDEIEVKKRLEENGYNEIKEKEKPKWLKIVEKFIGPIQIMIEIAALLSALVQKWDDFFVILALLITNVFVELWQQKKAENALKILKQKLETETLVLREGQWKSIPSRELVPGDIIRLRLGNLIPADAKLISGDYLSVDQSTLTGESLPVSKKVNDVVFANTIVKQGEMNAVVVNTAMNTFFGETAKLIKSSQKNKVSHYQKAVMKIADFLILFAVSLIILIFVVEAFRGRSFLDILKYALVLTVASIPSALPAVMSVTMAIGAINLAKKKAIVTKLASIEELAGMDVLCSDKTGTLTKNQLEVSDYIVKKPFDKKDVLVYASLASKEENKDTIDLSIIKKATEEKLTTKIKQYKQTNFIPFDPVKKRTEATIKKGSQKFWVTKGAPQIIESLCVSLKNEDREKIDEAVNNYASQGYRTLGVAIKRGSESKPWKWVGLIALSDPPRDDSKEMLKEAMDLGVKPKMITGDNVAIAKQIAKVLGLGTNIRTASELSGKSDEEIILLSKVLTKIIYKKLKNKASESEIKDAVDSVVKEVKKEFENTPIPKGYIKKHESEIVDIIESADGFAEVYPKHKYYIVSKLEEKGHFVGMTGDGVNDAPALEKANCGIAVSGATDAARAAADLVLINPGLKVIIDAIKEARKVFKRMNTYAIYRIAETLRIILFMTFSILLLSFYPITALMVILLAFFNDIPILAIAYDNATPGEKPERWDFKYILTIATTLGLIGVMFSFGIYYFGYKILNLSPKFLQTFIFLKLIVAGHFTLFNTRTKGAFWTSKPSWILLVSIFTTQFIAALFAVYGWLLAPIGWAAAGIVWAYAIACFLIADFVKVQVYKALDRSSEKEKAKENSKIKIVNPDFA